jgi:hypothetical protein
MPVLEACGASFVRVCADLSNFPASYPDGMDSVLCTIKALWNGLDLLA